MQLTADPARSAATYLTLPVATAVQLLSAAIPSLAVFRLEAGLRRWVGNSGE